MRPRETVTRSVAAGGGGVAQTEYRFRAGKLLCKIPWWVPVIPYLLKSTECTGPRVNLGKGCGLWVITRSRGGLITYNEGTALGQDVTGGGSCPRVGAEGIRKFCAFPNTFTPNLKLLLNRKILSKNISLSGPRPQHMEVPRLGLESEL